MPSWSTCSGVEGLESQKGISTNRISCAGRNLGFIIVGLLLQPSVLVEPLLEKDEEAEDSSQKFPSSANNLQLSEKPRGGAAESSVWNRNRRAESVNLISTITMPNSRRRQEVAAFLKSRRTFLRRNQVLANRSDRTQSDAIRLDANKAVRKAGRFGKRGSLKDKLLTSPTFDDGRISLNTERDASASSLTRTGERSRVTKMPLTAADLDRSVEVGDTGTAATAAFSATAVDIPTQDPVQGAADTPEVMSLPTPRTLRLLGSELMLKNHAPDLLRTRTFEIGDRVQASWNAFGYWYSGQVMAAADGKYTIKYDDDSVEATVPPELIRPAKVSSSREHSSWAALTDARRRSWAKLGWSEMSWLNLIPSPPTEWMAWAQLTALHRTTSYSHTVLARSIGIHACMGYYIYLFIKDWCMTPVSS